MWHTSAAPDDHFFQNELPLRAARHTAHLVPEKISLSQALLGKGNQGEAPESEHISLRQGQGVCYQCVRRDVPYRSHAFGPNLAYSCRVESRGQRVRTATMQRAVLRGAARCNPIRKGIKERSASVPRRKLCELQGQTSNVMLPITTSSTKKSENKRYFRHEQMQYCHCFFIMLAFSIIASTCLVKFDGSVI